MPIGVVLYPGFSEYEISVALSVFKQAEQKVTYIGLDEERVTGESGLECVVNETVENVRPGDYDCILLPGVDNFKHLVDHQTLINFIQKTNEEGVLIGAISSALYFLAMSGVLDHQSYTTGLTKEQRVFLNVFNENTYMDETVVVSKSLITAKGSAYVEFGLMLGRTLGLDFDPSWYSQLEA
ncbi:DJ-1/PfpI family protein [Halobacillus sp. GSS1]|uniref:DJ-1/PfpI family protein n=1 Tax=Halobacillus sp. GSS1 TaxID=2815919 RepID=UPI001F5E2EEF|nr:DJ-1/PfpI family protein [Halobacillus sp. GSS1]